MSRSSPSKNDRPLFFSGRDSTSPSSTALLFSFHTFEVCLFDGLNGALTHFCIKLSGGKNCSSSYSMLTGIPANISTDCGAIPAERIKNRADYARGGVISGKTYLAYGPRFFSSCERSAASTSLFARAIAPDGITADKDPLESGSPARGLKYWRSDIGTRVEEGWQGRWQEGWQEDWQEGWEKTPKHLAKAGNSIAMQAYTKHIHV